MKQRMQKRLKGSSSVNYQSEESDNLVELVLQIDGSGVKPFMIEGVMCCNKFKAKFNMGTLVSINGNQRIEKNHRKPLCRRRQRNDR